jgi:hypothetical protein
MYKRCSLHTYGRNKKKGGREGGKEREKEGRSTNVYMSYFLLELGKTLKIISCSSLI